MLPALERVAPHGRLRLRTPVKSMTWTFCARGTGTHEHVSVNVETMAVEWCLLGPVPHGDRRGVSAGPFVHVELADGQAAREADTTREVVHLPADKCIGHSGSLDLRAR